MQDKAYRENGSGRAYGRSGDIYPWAEAVPAFLFGNCFFGKDPVFSARLCFSAGSAEAEKEVWPFFFCRAESGWPSDFRLTG